MGEFNRAGAKYRFDNTHFKEGPHARVFGGVGNVGSRQLSVVTKRFTDTGSETARDELQFASHYLQNGESDSYSHIVPVYQVQDEVIVMPRAKCDLLEYIQSSPNISLEDMLNILKDICIGISKIGGRHSVDLQPSNVLFHDSAWKLSSIGSKMGHHEYSAPELWEHQPSTAGMDTYIYAIGGIAYHLLSGNLPFAGSSVKNGHLYSIPPKTNRGSKQLALLVFECLRKDRTKRPVIKQVIDRLSRITNTDEPFDAVLLEHEYLRQKNELSQPGAVLRRQKAQKAVDAVKAVLSALLASMDGKSTNLKVEKHELGKWGSVSIDGCKLEWRILSEFFKESEVALSGWDILAGAMIRVPAYSANLWYATHGDSEHGWWEVSYKLHDGIEPMHDWERMSEQFHLESPFHTDRYQPASAPERIDKGGKSSEFFVRWRNRFAMSLKSQLQRKNAAATSA